MERRIIALEEKCVFLERYVEELDGVVQDLQKRLDALHADLTRMRRETERRIDDLSRPAPPDDEPPVPGAQT